MITEINGNSFPLSGSPQWLKAYFLAMQGIKVFPCREKDSLENGVLKKKKSPYTTRGFLDASSDLLTVNSHFNRWPDALVGVWCGGSSLVVLDLDIKGSSTGEQELQKRDLAFDSPVRYNTPSGGLHVWFKEDPSRNIRPSVNFKGLPGVDVRAGNSYAIFYGDLHGMPGVEVSSSASSPVFLGQIHEIPDLPTPPHWMSPEKPAVRTRAQKAINHNGTFTGDVQKWIDWLGTDSPFWSAKAIAHEIEELDHIGHHDLIRLLVWIHQTRQEGETSLEPVLGSLISKFQKTTNNPHWERELNDAVRWVIGSDWNPEEREI